MNRIKNILRLTTLVLLATLFVFLMAPVLVWAQDAGPATVEVVETSPAGDILLMVLKIVFSILGLLATWLSMKGIAYFEKKTKIDLPASAELLISAWVEKGIGLAHEKSHQQVKKVGRKLGGSEKLNVALDYVKERVEESKLDAWAEAKLINLIEAKLGLKRQDSADLLPTAEVVAE